VLPLPIDLAPYVFRRELSSPSEGAADESSSFFLIAAAVENFLNEGFTL
jgi:hypothetical protein